MFCALQIIVLAFFYRPVQILCKKPCILIAPNVTKCSWCTLDEKAQDQSTLKNIQNLQVSTSINKFVVFSFTRSGSTFLSYLINSHADILSYLEIFHPSDVYAKYMYETHQDFVPRNIYDARNSKPRDLLRYVWSNSKNHSTVGFKLFGDQLCLRDVVEILIKESPQLKKIILYRSDMLGAYTSQQIAQKFQSWHFVNTSDFRVKINVNQFNKRKDDISSFYRIIATEIKKASQEYLLIEYNRDIRNKTNLETTLLNLQKFIGVTPLDLIKLYDNNTKKYPVLKKQSHVHVSSQIKNWKYLPAKVRWYANTSLDFNTLFM